MSDNPNIQTFANDFAWEDFNNAIDACRNEGLYTEANLMERVKLTLKDQVLPAMNLINYHTGVISQNCQTPDSRRPKLLANINASVEVMVPILTELLVRLQPKGE